MLVGKACRSRNLGQGRTGITHQGLPEKRGQWVIEVEGIWRTVARCQSRIHARVVPSLMIRNRPSETFTSEASPDSAAWPHIEPAAGGLWAIRWRPKYSLVTSPCNRNRSERCVEFGLAEIGVAGGALVMRPQSAVEHV